MMEKLKKHIIDEKGRPMTLVGDIYLHDFFLEWEEEEEQRMNLGKYGRMRKSYLKNHDMKTYLIYLTKGKLPEHLAQVDREMTEAVEKYVKQMAEAEGTNEELKARDQMTWVGLMNNYRHSAEEIFLPDYVYA